MRNIFPHFSPLNSASKCKRGNKVATLFFYAKIKT